MENERHLFFFSNFANKQERCLHAVCVRTMALPVGRGKEELATYIIFPPKKIFTDFISGAISMSLSSPLPTEPMPVPKLWWEDGFQYMIQKNK